MLQEQIAADDGLLLATPEYNNSILGVFKNAIDWLSRLPSFKLIASCRAKMTGAAGREQMKEQMVKNLKQLRSAIQFFQEEPL